ncbi:hypothetical protein JYB55_18860 [Mycolicibacterium septicum]|nr:hypothetical protein [Mycolicibacterium septicum]
MSNTTLWTIGLAAVLLAGAMLARYIVGRTGLRERLSPRTVVVVAWTTAALSAIGAVAAIITGASNIGWTTAILVVAATVALLLHKRMQTATPADDANNNLERE